jgi:hypothetical protein
MVSQIEVPSNTSNSGPLSFCATENKKDSIKGTNNNNLFIFILIKKNKFSKKFFWKCLKTTIFFFHKNEFAYATSSPTD